MAASEFRLDHYGSLWIVVLTSFLICYVNAQSNGGVGLCTSPQATSNRIFIHDVPETTAVGAILIHLNVLGTDAEVRLRIVRGDPHIRFDPASRNVTLRQELDREEFPAVELELGCIILATDQEIKIPIDILIQDINDNPPVFQQPSYSTNVSELTPTGTTVIRNIGASDRDIDNWYITYEVMPGPFLEASEYFDIPNPAKGEVVLQKSLDFELLKVMTFKVKAKDNHDQTADTRQREALTTVTVYIFDGDDQNPQFLNAPYRATIVESMPKGSPIPVSPPVKAIDQDLGINASVVYNIVPTWADGSNEYFTIDATTARITLTQTAGIKRGQVHPVLIRATQLDNEDRYATTMLYVTVAPANENPPRFGRKEYRTRVVENTPIGSVVITLQAADNDEGARLVYSFGTGPISPDFELDLGGGVLKTKRPLDHERKAQYRLKIQVSDGSFSDQTTVVVDIVNVNDNPPVFPSPVTVFTAPFTEGATVGRLEAFDADPVTNVRYFFKDHVTLFSISEDGDIIIAGTREQFNQNTYRLFVVATDNGNPPLEGSTVVEVNFSPMIALPVTLPSSGENLNSVLVIVLGVICGCLLVIIIIMAVYIYRSRLKARKPKNDFVRSQSFESRLNLNRDLGGRTYLDDADGLSFKPAKAHHLAMYNDVSIDPDATSPQVNPFIPDEQLSSQYASHNTSNPGFRYDSQDINDNMNKHYSSGSSMDLNKRMNAVNEIEYDTALAPMPERAQQRVNGSVANESAARIPGPPSAHSSFQSLPGNMSTFRAGGSTQRLMTPRGTPKGSINKKPQVSFVENHEVNVYHPQYGKQHAIDPTIANMVGAPVEEEKPGITIYY